MYITFSWHNNKSSWVYLCKKPRIFDLQFAAVICIWMTSYCNCVTDLLPCTVIVYSTLITDILVVMHHDKIICAPERDSIARFLTRIFSVDCSTCIWSLDFEAKMTSTFFRIHYVITFLEDSSFWAAERIQGFPWSPQMQIWILAVEKAIFNRRCSLQPRFCIIKKSFNIFAKATKKTIVLSLI